MHEFLTAINGSLNSNLSSVSSISSKINRRNTIITELNFIGLQSIGNLLSATEISANGIETFSRTTGIALTKPVENLLTLYEHTLKDDGTSSMPLIMSTFGFSIADFVTFDLYMSKLYK